MIKHGDFDKRFKRTQYFIFGGWIAILLGFLSCIGLLFHSCSKVIEHAEEKGVSVTQLISQEFGKLSSDAKKGFEEGTKGD